MRIRRKYDSDHKEFSDKNKFEFTLPSMVSREFKADCDIDSILRKYSAQGVNPFDFMERAEYLDFDKEHDYQDIRNHMIKIQS
ncbi:MAG: hypothetical protein ACRC1P_05585, partial [Cellulosilyticaceae bacterium]